MANARTGAKDDVESPAQAVRHEHTSGQLHPAIMLLRKSPAVHLGDGRAKMGMYANELHHVVCLDGVQEPLNSTSL